jgi:hypothetical protein
LQETARYRRTDFTLGHVKHLAEQRNQRKTAGESSGIARAGRAAKRRLFVKMAFDQVHLLERMQPNSNRCMRELEAAYARLLIEKGFRPKTPPFKVSRETLRSDLKRLGIRSWRRSK